MRPPNGVGRMIRVRQETSGLRHLRRQPSPQSERVTLAKKVFVSGCFDLLHAGHVTFLKTAAQRGQLHVCIGSDQTIRQLKGSYPLMGENERVYILEALECVHQVHVGSGNGLLDFEPELRQVRPDLFIVNSDGHDPKKRAMCDELGMEYMVLDRVPEEFLPERSSTSLKKRLRIPYRVALSGGWIDQPFMSTVCPGHMVVVSIEPTHEFNDRSGMATSSRKTLMEIWGQDMPAGGSEKLARILFAAENPPGSQYISGSQDMIGLTYPGVTCLHYDGQYWPNQIESTVDAKAIRWLEEVLFLVELWPRPDGFDPLAGMTITEPRVRQLGESGLLCWQSILAQDVDGLGRSFDMTTEAWRHLVPASLPEKVLAKMDEYRNRDGCAGIMASGAGGGGYLIIASQTPINGGIRVTVRT